MSRKLYKKNIKVIYDLLDIYTVCLRKIVTVARYRIPVVVHRHHKRNGDTVFSVVELRLHIDRRRNITFDRVCKQIYIEPFATAAVVELIIGVQLSVKSIFLVLYVRIVNILYSIIFHAFPYELEVLSV